MKHNLLLVAPPPAIIVTLARFPQKIKAEIQHGGGVMKSAYTIIRRGEYEH